jgi:hypothetical protein
MMLAGGVVPTGDAMTAMADAYKGTKRHQFRTQFRTQRCKEDAFVSPCFYCK